MERLIDGGSRERAQGVVSMRYDGIEITLK